MSFPAIHANWARLQQHAQRWLSPLGQRAAALGIERWRNILIAVLALWIIANLARLIWLLLPLPDTAAVTVQPINAAADTARQTAVAIDIEKMASWHLFGEVGAQPRVAALIEEQVQETTLNLQLLGVIAASEPTQARAFIQADGKQQQFAIDEQLPGAGKVVLSKVLVDRVIIDNNGRYETLWLYDPNASAQTLSSPAATSTAAVDLRGDAEVTEAAVGYRQQLYQNPTGLADVIQVAPAMENGKLAGYRVNPGRDPAQFAQFGLKPGDIITSVNGISLQNPQSALELYNLLRSAREASITVQRGTASTVLHVSLDDAAAPSDTGDAGDGD